MNPTDDNWLEKLQPGDVVFEVYPGVDRIFPFTVTRTTKLHVIVNGRSYRKKNGWQVGSHDVMSGTYLEPDTPKNRKRHIQTEAVHAIRRDAAWLYQLKTLPEDPVLLSQLQTHLGAACYLILHHREAQKNQKENENVTRD
jgi:hypothetical protein